MHADFIGQQHPLKKTIVLSKTAPTEPISILFIQTPPVLSDSTVLFIK